MDNIVNNKPMELELKYIVDESNMKVASDLVKALFRDKGFSLESITKKENSDEYYDTADLDFFKNRSSLRIRTTTKKDQTKYKGTLKMPSDGSSEYLNRPEFEKELSNPTFEEFKKVMTDSYKDLNFDNIFRKPILNSTTARTDMIFKKNGLGVCVSIDKTTYTNHILEELEVTDNMIEIESLDSKDSSLLDEVYCFLSCVPENLLAINKQSKYERGISSTLFAYDKTNITDFSDLVKKKS